VSVTEVEMEVAMVHDLAEAKSVRLMRANEKVGQKAGMLAKQKGD